VTRSAIITGASRGIGAETARALARQGTNLVLAVRDPDSVTALEQELRSLGVRVVTITCDVSDHRSVQAMAATALDSLGNIDILINNAGALEPIGLIEDADPEAWLQSVTVNLAGAYFPIHELLPHFRAAGSGTIVNLSTGAAFMPLRGWSAYCSSKAGLAMLTRTLAVEVADTDIRIYGFQPGMVNTGMTREGLQKKVNEVSEFNVDEFLHPSEPAGAIAELCTRRPADFHGEEIRCGDTSFMEWMGDNL